MEDQDRNYQDECGDHGGTNSRGNPCGRAAGWGTPDDSGKCRRHRGTSPDGSSHEGNDFAKGNSGGGAPEGNTNGESHGMFADEHAFYDQIASDAEVEIIDNVYLDYLERFRSKNSEPDYGDKVELFMCAVTIGKEIHGENWAADKPEGLDAGNALVDEETRYTQDGREYSKYKTTVIQRGATSLSNRRRKWLKAMGLLDDPDSQAADSVASLAEVLSED